jgi:hypothetical protein
MGYYHTHCGGEKQLEGYYIYIHSLHTIGARGVHFSILGGVLGADP